MGCTSSAANMPKPLNTEQNVSISEDAIKKAVKEKADEMYGDKENETNSTKYVLPTCDTLAEPTQLARNNKSFIQVRTLDTENHRGQENHMVFEADDNKSKKSNNLDTPEQESSQTDDKMSTLEEVAEKVVELFIAENSIIENAQNTAQENQNTDNLEEITHGDSGSKETEDIGPEEAAETNIETLEMEVASPSQSQSSRATRWEALADIAAELPPSLAVDPLTGQIYSLTK